MSKILGTVGTGVTVGQCMGTGVTVGQCMGTGVTVGQCMGTVRSMSVTHAGNSGNSKNMSYNVGTVGT